MDSKHLTKGDPCPPLVNGKLRIYSMRFCPYAQRALLVVAAKRIPYDVININLVNKPEFIFDKNPAGKVPALELPLITGCIYESLILCDLLDEIYPETGSGGDVSESFRNRLHSSEPFQKALDRILVEKMSLVTTYDHEAWFLPEDSSDEEVRSVLQSLFASLIPFEEELAGRETKFFAGDTRPGMVDYMIWPWLERLPSQELMWKDKFDFKAAKMQLRLLNAWAENMKQEPAILQSYLSPEIHLKYRMSRKKGTPDYDMLLNR